MIRLASLLVLLPLAAAAEEPNPNGGLSRPFLGSPGSLSNWDLLPDMVPDGRWDWGAVPGYGMAAARAVAVSEEIADAVLSLTCLEGRGGPELNVYVNYWLAEDAAAPDPAGGLVGAVLSGDLTGMLPPPALEEDNVYTMDIFNSMRSGRPASYDLGQGIVPTTHISFPFNEAPPADYHAATDAFRAALRELPPDGRIVLRFVTRRGEGEAKLRFPAEGLAGALDLMAERSGACPP